VTKKEKSEKALKDFLAWRELNCSGLNFAQCWKLIMEMRAEGNKLDFINDVRFHPLRKAINGDSEIEVTEDLCGDEEVVEANVTLQRKVQKLQDTQRIERKGWRSDSRIYNAMEEYNKALLSELSKTNLASFTVKHDVVPKCPVGIITLSDLHLNELVCLAHNKYDFKVAAKRLKLLISKARIYFKALGVKQVLVSFLGDLLNSNRRVDELLNMATNRAKASILSVYLLEQVILDLNKDFNVTCLSVSGNESRIEKDWSWSEMIASDNFDVTIFNTLKYVFRDAQGISFIDGDVVEQIVDINGSNFLFTHGMQISSDIEKSVQQLKGKYSSQGITVDYVLVGHVHSARVGDTYARNSSLVGANAYSDRGLNLDGRASQNIIIVHADGNRDGIKIDLQNIEGVEGYDIIEQLEAYDAKSAGKLKTNRVIFQIVI
jgi:predicted phosphodiesterase